MKTTARLILTLPSLLLLLLTALPAHSQNYVQRVDAPDERGPWAVGRQSISLVDASREDRAFSIDVWYPVDPEDASGALTVYDLVFAAVESDFALADVLVSDAQAHPMVVFSHGSFGLRFQSWFLMEMLASHGFIVVAPDHTGNTAIDVLFGTEVPFEQSAIDRPQDISFVIDTMLAFNNTPGDAFDGRIDASRIGMTGHSFGGFTTLAMSSGYEPNPIDSRIIALAPIAPASGVLTDKALSTVSLPTIILGGTQDITTPIVPESTRPFKLIQARPRYRVDIADAGHLSFTNICPIADALLAAGLPVDFIELILGSLDEGCGPDLIPYEEAHRVTNLFAVSFMQYFVAGNARYRTYFSPSWISSNEPGVEYFKVRGLLGP